MEFNQQEFILYHMQEPKRRQIFTITKTICGFVTQRAFTKYLFPILA